MPYITTKRRNELLMDGDLARPNNAGELNYLFCKIMLLAKDEDEVYTKARFLATAYLLTNGLSYQKLNDVSGALVNAEREYERRTTKNRYKNVMGRVLDTFYNQVVVPYEKKKIVENGDIF